MLRPVTKCGAGNHNREVVPYNVLDGGGLIVHEGARYTVLEEGNPQLQVDEN